MADGDSLYELSSDQDMDPDAMDGDVENDDTADDWWFNILLQAKNAFNIRGFPFYKHWFVSGEFSFLRL